MKTGISVYCGLNTPQEKNLSLLERAAARGITRLFTSLQIPETDAVVFRSELKTLLAKAKELQFDVIADISQAASSLLDSKESNPSELMKLGITTLRLDDGFSPEDAADLLLDTPGLRIQLNASTVTQEYLEKMNKKNHKFKNIFQSISNKTSKSEKSFEDNIDDNIILNLNNSYNSQERVLKSTYFNNNNFNQEKINHKTNNINSLIGEKLKFIDYSKQRFTDKIDYLNPNQSYLIYNPVLLNKLFYNSYDRINELNKKNINIENKSNEDYNNDINYTKKKYESLLKNDRLIKYRDENNKRLEYLMNNSNSNIENKENETLLNYELNTFNIDKNPKTLKQKFNTLSTKNDINSARNEIEFLNEKLKLNEQRRKMFLQKYESQNMNTNNNICNSIDNNDSNTNFTRTNFSSEKLRIPNFTFQRKKYIIF